MQCNLATCYLATCCLATCYLMNIRADPLLFTLEGEEHVSRLHNNKFNCRFTYEWFVQPRHPWAPIPGYDHAGPVNLKFLHDAPFLQNGKIWICHVFWSQHLGCWGQNTSLYAQGCDLSCTITCYKSCMKGHITVGA